jgi:hypothetical protein
MNDHPERPQASLARDVAARFDLSDDARELLTPDARPAEFFALLSRHEMYRDAFNFAAHYLPKRASIWWGCLCAWELYRDNVPANEEGPIRAVVDWILEPTEEHRRAAYTGARTGKVGAIGSSLAMAVFAAEGSLAPADAPEVRPPDDQSANFVAAAVIIAGQMAPRKKRQQYQHHFLELAVELSQGKALCSQEEGEPEAVTIN